MSDENYVPPVPGQEDDQPDGSVDELVTVLEPEVTDDVEDAAPEAPVATDSTEDEEYPSGLSLDEVAKQVVEGKWGVGQIRRQKLDNAGYNVQEVDEKVKELLNP
jgi:hypothetical protein